MASVLVVEDSPSVLLSIKLILERRGHQVTGVENGTRGLDMVSRGAFDLVITDIQLPGTGGVELIREGRKRSPKTRFLAITGGESKSHDPVDAVSRQDFGADGVLPKPFAIKEFLSAVSILLEVAA